MPARRLPEHKLTMDLIKVNDANWPPTVKARAKEIVTLTANLRIKNQAVAETAMLDAAKVRLMAEVGELHMQLATACRNLSKELAYHISHING